MPLQIKTVADTFLLHIKKQEDLILIEKIDFDCYKMLTTDLQIK